MCGFFFFRLYQRLHWQTGGRGDAGGGWDGGRGGGQGGRQQRLLSRDRRRGHYPIFFLLLLLLVKLFYSALAPPFLCMWNCFGMVWWGRNAFSPARGRREEEEGGGEGDVEKKDDLSRG